MTEGKTRILEDSTLRVLETAPHSDILSGVWQACSLFALFCGVPRR